jgi:hypothetical protein
MTVALVVMAGTIAFLYSFYVFKIIKGEPEGFELELLQALANWMVQKGTSSRGQLWLMLLLAFLFELVYFLLVFSVVSNLFLLILAGFFVAVEAYHLTSFAASLGRFFRGDIKLKHLFNWRWERISAVLFFTYSLLLLIHIIVY